MERQVIEPIWLFTIGATEIAPGVRGDVEIYANHDGQMTCKILPEGHGKTGYPWPLKLAHQDECICTVQHVVQSCPLHGAAAQIGGEK